MYRNGALQVQFFCGISCQHVGVSLVHTPIGNIDIQIKYVRHLHNRIKQLGEVLFRFLLLPSHDVHCSFYPCNRICFGDFQNELPVSGVRYIIARIHEINFIFADSHCLETILHVFSTCLYFVKVSTEFVVYVCMPICQ